MVLQTINDDQRGALSIVRDTVTTGEKVDMEFSKRQIRWRKYGGRA
jgi:hypothetical protein